MKAQLCGLIPNGFQQYAQQVAKFNLRNERACGARGTGTGTGSDERWKAWKSSATGNSLPRDISG